MGDIRKIVLDERLQTVADLFPVVESAADIGADHGRLTCYLLESGKCRHMIVSDISAASLEKARHLLTKHGLETKATFVVADGFEALNRPVSIAAICGMGGKTIAAMLEGTSHALTGHPDLILSAHTELPRLRTALMNSCYTIEREYIVVSVGRFYHVLHACYGQDIYTDKQIRMGVALESKAPGDLVQYYRWELRLQEKKRPRDEKMINWLKEEIDACGSFA